MNSRRSREKRSISYLTKDDIKFILHHFDNKCPYCNIELTFTKGFDNSIELDHYISLKEGDTDEYLILEGLTFKNTLAVCRKCNRSKSSSNAETWIKNNFSNAESIIYNIDFYFSTIDFSFS